jgi:hypothetical protein
LGEGRWERGESGAGGEQRGPARVGLREKHDNNNILMIIEVIKML